MLARGRIQNLPIVPHLFKVHPLENNRRFGAYMSLTHLPSSSLYPATFALVK
jgi:hypothetical protein